jgi:hypothetical protein
VSYLSKTVSKNVCEKDSLKAGHERLRGPWHWSHTGPQKFAWVLRYRLGVCIVPKNGIVILKLPLNFHACRRHLSAWICLARRRRKAISTAWGDCSLQKCPFSTAAPRRTLVKSESLTSCKTTLTSALQTRTKTALGRHQASRTCPLGHNVHQQPQTGPRLERLTARRGEMVSHALKDRPQTLHCCPLEAWVSRQ